VARHQGPPRGHEDLLRPEPKTQGSKSHARFELYSRCATLGELRGVQVRGNYRDDILHDVRRGFMRIHGVDLGVGVTVAALAEGGVPLRSLERDRENPTYGGRAITDDEWNLATHCEGAARFFHVVKLEEGDPAIAASGTDEEHRLERSQRTPAGAR
jgi:hypothetical protein